MDDIEVKEFPKTKTVDVCYIYGTTKNNGGSLKTVHFYKRNTNNKNNLERWTCGVSRLANYLINGDRIAYAVEIKVVNNLETMINPSLVTVRTLNGKLMLTTASDDSESNNLLCLPEYKE